MNRIAPIYLDTNVLISFGESDGIVRQRLLDVINRQQPDQPPVFLTSRLTFAELMVRPLREKDSVMASIYSAWALSGAWLRVCEVDEAVLSLAPLLRVHAPRLKLPDAIHLACAIVQKCPIFLTSDQGFNDVAGLEHPFLGSVDMVPLSVVRPDSSFLATLVESLN